MRIEQSVGSYPTPRYLTEIRRLFWFEHHLTGSRQLDTAADTDGSRSRRSFRTFELIFVKCPCNAVSMQRHYTLFVVINEMIGLHLVPTKKKRLINYRVINYHMLLTLLINSHKLRMAYII